MVVIFFGIVLLKRNASTKILVLTVRKKICIFSFDVERILQKPEKE